MCPKQNSSGLTPSGMARPMRIRSDGREPFIQHDFQSISIVKRSLETFQVML